MDALEELGVRGTFFFCSRCFSDSGLIRQVNGGAMAWAGIPARRMKLRIQECTSAAATA